MKEGNPTLGNRKFLRILEWLNNHPGKGFECDECGKWYKACFIQEHGEDFLCPKCHEDREIIEREEEKLHHKGGI